MGSYQHQQQALAAATPGRLGVPRYGQADTGEYSREYSLAAIHRQTNTERHTSRQTASMY